MGWHLVITEEMRSLGLSGNDLMVFALIYGFSQNGQGCFYGSISYICETCGISKSTTLRILQDLTQKGFIIKKEIYENGVKSVSYRSGVKMTPGVSKCNEGGVKMKPNIIEDINISPTEINNKGKRFDFKKSLIEIGVSPEVADDWMQVRKTKRASNTETAFRRIKNEIDKSGLSANECITIAVARSWQGFQADWVANQQRSRPTGRVSVLDNNRMVAEELIRIANMEQTS